MVSKAELFLNHYSSPDAAYAVDLLTRVVSALLRPGDSTLAEIVGDESLADEVHHAIGWDIDWDEVYNGRQGGC